jgi:hypothetical protein
VRLFQNGEVMLHIEPLARPVIWNRFRMESGDTPSYPPQEGGSRGSRAVVARPMAVAERSNSP